MTPAQIHARAKLNRQCGLAKDADMIDALADLVEKVERCVARSGDPELRTVLERIGALDFEFER